MTCQVSWPGLCVFSPVFTASTLPATASVKGQRLWELAHPPEGRAHCSFFPAPHSSFNSLLLECVPLLHAEQEPQASAGSLRKVLVL